jgi:membrane protease YdiL (CAAX protease family)
MSEIALENPFLLSLFCIAIIPAIFEESVYRGIFYQEYRKINPFGAIFFSALLFGLLHGNLNQFTYAFVMGVIMALIIEATDSILATMIIHFIINGMSVTLLYALPKMNVNYDELLEKTKEISSDSFITVLQVNGVPAIIGGIIGYMIFLQLAKNSNRLEHVNNLFSKKTRVEKSECPPIRSLLTLPLIIAIVFCIITIILSELLLRGVITS